MTISSLKLMKGHRKRDYEVHGLEHKNNKYLYRNEKWKELIILEKNPFFQFLQVIL